jgi:hypothetical protein
MHRRFLSLPLVFAVVAFSAAPAPRAASPSGLVVHEWGTFTSVASIDGDAVTWSALSGPQDLPCFVERAKICVKCDVPGTIRMETPVLYLYSPAAVTARVNVSFPHGLISEWYPRATVAMATTYLDPAVLRSPTFTDSIAWPSVRVTPGAAEHFPRETGASHYYLARDTAAAPVLVGDQQEKFLFYRGIGTAPPPISARVGGHDAVTVQSRRGQPAGDLIRFENRRGVMAYDVRHADGSSIVIPAPVLQGETVPPTDELERLLVAHGLFREEARAMVATWRDSWFVEGSRVFYIVDNATIDAMLPMTITPAPTRTTRVFVGRVELPTSTTIAELRSALVGGDAAALAKYGRFARPLADSLLAGGRNAEWTRWQALLADAAFAAAPASPRCAAPAASGR